jgi:photosystem II stability/assembly factor-like uncharacterized protein
VFLAVALGGGDQLNATHNGGTTWKLVATQHATPGFFGWGQLRFTSAEVGYVLGPTHYARPRLYRTLDGGAHWVTARLPPRIP